MINFFEQECKRPRLDYRKIKKWVKLVVEQNNFCLGDISVVFCSDIFLLDYNNKYLNHNYLTDIITFNYNDTNVISGDLFISIDTVSRNAVEYKVPVDHEFLRVIIHGILHLIGFDDKNDEDVLKMREQEQLSLDLFFSFQ